MGLVSRGLDGRPARRLEPTAELTFLQRQLDHGKCVAKLATSETNAVVYLQVTDSGGVKLRCGLIIRRSWVRSPPAPLFEIPLLRCVFLGRQVGVTVIFLRRWPLGLPMAADR